MNRKTVLTTNGVATILEYKYTGMPAFMMTEAANFANLVQIR